jgi:hypothetical protein
LAKRSTISLAYAIIIIVFYDDKMKNSNWKGGYEMAIYLNTNKPLENYKNLYRSKYFVDKSLFIEKLSEIIETSDKYICVTRPRRFGKSSVADMVGAYYSKAVDSKEIFDTLNIGEVSNYEKHLNKYNVINISFNTIAEIGNAYDDYIFANNLFEENQNDFLEFLRNLLKDQPYVSLAYMTGVLPIKKYSSGSALNMFDEFTFLKDRTFDEYFGFTEDEVIELCNKNKNISFKELESWYNGYLTAKGIKVYNPRSVVKALQNNYCESYWTNTGAMDEVAEYLKYNILEIRDDVIEMVSGEEIDITIDEDFTFHPRRKNDIPFIVELKKDELPEVAINQIREKEYVEKIRREDEGKKVLAVPICYDSKSKEHRCLIDRL